ncbi:MAG: sulfide/dihydroorotate dehydrogenase-like FAD/NAD-binding protein [Candidatus Geothermincolia bacterium]
MPHKILERQQLSEQVFAMRVAAPMIAQEAQAGQFVILRLSEHGERFPLTLADWNAREGWIFLVFQVVGASTLQFSRLEVGDAVLDVVGPLGIPSEIKTFGRVLCVGGGIGIAALYPIARALADAGNEVFSIIGARTAELLILEDEMKAVSSQLVVMTDDGSRGNKGLVTWAMEEELKGEGAQLVLAIGPAVMMKFCSAVSKPYGVETKVSLNSIMLDGTGMCGTCRVEVCGKTRFACVDGPEFDGHEVDWELLLNRLAQYKQEEAVALEAARTGCDCR